MILHTSRAEAIVEVLARLAGLPGTRWIGVDGLGAAGKTTLAEDLAAALRVARRSTRPSTGPGVAVVHVDDFARPDLHGWERDRFVRQLLEPLLSGEPAHYQRWDFDSNSGANWLTILPGGPVIVEGVSATDERVPVPWDVTLWLEVPRALREQRIRQRDGEALRERWLTDWWPGEGAYERDQRPQQRADIIVDGLSR